MDKLPVNRLLPGTADGRHPRLRLTVRVGVGQSNGTRFKDIWGTV